MRDDVPTLVHFVRTGPRVSNPVVLIHPVGLDLTFWDRQIEALRGIHDVVAFDLPGHGASAGGADGWSFPYAVETLAHLLDEIGAAKAHVIGISVGGMIAQAFAVRHPERTRSLVLIATATTFPQGARQALRNRAATAREQGMHSVLQSTIERWFTSKTVAERPDLIDRVSKCLLADDPFIHGAMWDMIAELDLADGLATVSCPALILAGEVDPSCPPEASYFMQSRIRGSSVEVFPETSHMIILERPDMVSESIMRFLASVG